MRCLRINTKIFWAHLSSMAQFLPPLSSDHGVRRSLWFESKICTTMGRPRRQSSGLQGDPRGDTGAPAVSTLEAPAASSQSSPVCRKRSVKSWKLIAKSVSTYNLDSSGVETHESSIILAEMEKTILDSYLGQSTDPYSYNTWALPCEPQRI